MIFVEFVLWEAESLHLSESSRDQLKAHVLVYHHLLLLPAPSLVSDAAPTKSSAAAACIMESFLCRQLIRRAAFHEWIPLGERTIRFDCQTCAHRRYGNDSPGATLAKSI